MNLFAYHKCTHDLGYLLHLQYLPPYIKSKRPLCDRFAVLASVAIVWIYAGILTWSDGPNKKSTDALTSCRTDRAGLVNAAPWLVIYCFS